MNGVRDAYDTVAADYARHLPDARAEARLDLAMIDEFAATVTRPSARVLDADSIIHTPPIDHARIFTESARVLRPDGRVLIGSQSGQGIRDVGPVYRAFGHVIELVRYLTTADEIVARLEEGGLQESARLVRRASGSENEDQAFVLAQAT